MILIRRIKGWKKYCSEQSDDNIKCCVKITIIMINIVNFFKTSFLYIN